MTDLDLERLGDVWRQRPDPAELEGLKRSAEKVRRGALWRQRVDLVSSIVIGSVVLFLVLSSPRPVTWIVGGAVLAMLLASQIRSRRLREEELRDLTGSAENMVEQSIDRLDSTRKRMRFHLMLLIPGIALGLLVAKLVDDRAGTSFFEEMIPDPKVQLALRIAGFAFLAVSAFWLWRSHLRNKQELSWLLSLREDYRRESHHPGDASPTA